MPVIQWQVKNGKLFQPFSLPVVAETFDGYLNDINGFHIQKSMSLRRLRALNQEKLPKSMMEGNGSGDIFIAFSTANSQAAEPVGKTNGVQMVLNDELAPLFEATILATEEAIINAMVVAETMAGIDGHKVYGIRTAT